MGPVESALYYGVAKGAEVAKSAAWNFAKTQTLANVLGIGTTASAFALMAAEHAKEIAQVSGWVAGKLVRNFP